MNRIHEFRLDRQMTQRQLAQIAGISQSYLNELEKGKKKNPSIKMLDKIANALGVEVTRLLSKQA